MTEAKKSEQGHEEPINPELPAQILQAIEDEVARDIKPLLAEGDEETAVFQQEVMTDLRTTECRLLNWVRQTAKPRWALFPASGAERLPKLILGEEQVIHISLEEADEREYFDEGVRKKAGKKHFDELGSGIKITADNRALPLADESVDLVCLLSTQTELIGKDPGRYLRVLKPGGLMVLSKNNMLNPEDDRAEIYAQRPELEAVEIPEGLEMQGAAMVELAVLRKKAEIDATGQQVR